MGKPPLGQVVRHLRQVVKNRPADEVADRDLLQSFAAEREEAAFAALVKRHGAMVLGVCRRVLGDWHDAEDAFQGTFLVLARKAASIRGEDSLASWLYGVAHRVALKAKVRAARRRKHEKQAGARPARLSAAQEAWQELGPLLDQELARLPERYRAPLVLCYLEGKTRDEAAEQLDWTQGMVKGRLERGRRLLRTRLARRGLTLSAALLVPSLTQATASAALTSTLCGSTVQAAMLVAAGKTAAALGAPAAVLAEGVLRSMCVTKLTMTAALVLVVGAAGTGAGFLAHRTFADPPGDAPSGGIFSPGNRPADDGKGDGERLQGTWVGVTGERDAKQLPAKEIEDLAFVIRGDRINVLGKTLTFRLDPSRSPKGMYLTPRDGPKQGETAPAIYRLEGDRLTICLDDAGGKNRPAEFATRPGSGLLLFVLRRATPQEARGVGRRDGEQKANLAQEQALTVNHLKQIGLAMHNYNDSYGRFPPAAIYSKDGKPLLSWRVLLLPYLEQDALFKAFKLDEPWDSPNNKMLLNQMPKIYAPVTGQVKDKHSTFYQVFVGKGAMFERGTAVRVADITDGTSNTIMVVEAGESVPWTKPADVAFEPDKPLPKLGGLFKGRFYATFADGSVRAINDKVDDKVLRPFITRAGGEVVNPDDLQPKD